MSGGSNQVTAVIWSETITGDPGNGLSALNSFDTMDLPSTIQLAGAISIDFWAKHS